MAHHGYRYSRNDFSPFHFIQSLCNYISKCGVIREVAETICILTDNHEHIRRTDGRRESELKPFKNTFLNRLVYENVGVT